MIGIRALRPLAAVSLVLVVACAPRPAPAPGPAPPTASEPARPASADTATAPPPGPTEPARTAPVPAGPLADAIAAVIGSPPVDRAHWGIVVQDPASGRILYERNADKLFITASNMKLVTTAVAMGELGPSFRYHTPVYAIGRRPGGVIDTLLIEGRGDPTLSGRFHDGDLAAIDSLADSLAIAGIRRVDGPLLIDASYFDDRFLHPAWEVGDLDWYYAAPVAAFAIAEGAAAVVLRSTTAGRPARLERVEPVTGFEVQSEVVTADTGRLRVETIRRPGADTVHLAGTIPAGAPPDTTWLAVGNPVRYAGSALLDALAERGIRVDGGLAVVLDTAEARALPGPGDPRTERLVEWSSPPLADIVAGVLQPSQNWVAEMVLKTLGARAHGQGSWETGTDAAGLYLYQVAGIDSAGFYLRDGSGLSAQNLLTPRAIARLLGHTRQAWWSEDFRRALAAPGAEEHTLERRLEGLEDRVRAKTGTIRHVNSLSGFVRTDDGRDLIFSILTNGSGVPAGTMRDAIDRIVRIIAQSGGAR